MKKIRAVLTLSNVVLVTACSIATPACSGSNTVSIAEENGDDSFGSGVGIRSRTSRDTLDRSGLRAMGIADFDSDAADPHEIQDSGAADADLSSTEDGSVAGIEDAGSLGIEDAGSLGIEDAGSLGIEDAGSLGIEDASDPNVTDAGDHGSGDAESHSGTGSGDGDPRWRRGRYRRR